MSGRSLAVLAIAVGAAGCDVPAVSFYGDDGGGVDAAEASPGFDAAFDVEGVDAAPDVLPDALADAPDAGGCGVEVLAEASTCCGTVVCQGDCASQCATCEQKCSAPQVCCAHNQSVTCHGPGPCP